MGRLVVPLDVPSREAATELVDRLGDDADFYKVGLELYTRVGPDMVRVLKERGKRVFLDLKLHDIPNTVGRAVEAATALDVDLLTLHAVGGTSMLESAVSACGDRTRLLAVTALTSLSPDEMSAVWGRDIRSVREEVGRLTDLARDAGVDGVVSSPREAAWIRRRTTPDFLIVTPGIRPSGARLHDQSRVATPGDAVRAGADLLVVGRPITAAADPVAALHRVLAEITEAESAD